MTASIRFQLVALLVVALVVAITGCTSQSDTGRTSEAARTPDSEVRSDTPGTLPTGASGATDGAVDRPATIREFPTNAREVFNFDTLGEMVATSTLVIEAEVESIRPSREIGVDSDQKLKVDAVTLRVSRVFFGGQVATVIVEEDGILAANSNSNDAGIYFLMEKRDQPGVFRLASSAGRYRLDASGKLHGSNPESELSVALEKLGISDLRAHVEAAVAEVRSGEHAAVPYPTPDPGETGG